MAKIVLRAGKVPVKVTLPIMFLVVLLYSDRLLTPLKAEDPNTVGSALKVPLDVNWNNAGGNRRWDNAANWETGAVPTDADKAVIKGMLVSGPIIDVSTTIVAFQIVVSDWSSFGDTLDITGGTLTTGDWFIIGYQASNDGTFNVSGGTTTVGGHMFVGFNGAGHVNMTGGSITVSGTLGIAQGTGSGDVLLNGGTISCGSFSMQTGATIDIGSGMLIVNGDTTSTINGYIANGWLTAYGSSGTLNVDYNGTNPGKTTVTADATEEASYPSPANGVPGVSINADLSWTAGAYAVSHDVYFGTDPTPDKTEFMGNQTETTFDPGTMDMGTTYYWQIDEVNPGNPASPWTGNVWNFTTQVKASEIMEQLWAQYSADERFVEYVKRVADEFLLVGEYEKALGIYEYVVDNWTNDEYQLWGKVGIIKAHIGLGGDPNDQQLNELLTEFTGHPELPEAIFYIAEQYYQAAQGYEGRNDTNRTRQCLQKAIALWKDVPQSSDISDSELLNEEKNFLVAESYYRLGQYQEAIKYYKEVTANWPDYKHAPHIHLMTGKSYEQLKKSKAISPSSADIEILSSYQKAVEANPESPAAKIAVERLSSYQAH